MLKNTDMWLGVEHCQTWNYQLPSIQATQLGIQLLNKKKMRHLNQKFLSFSYTTKYQVPTFEQTFLNGPSKMKNLFFFWVSYLKEMDPRNKDEPPQSNSTDKQR
ncbi:hypothetical protein V6Z11_D10G179400 [Gossypium hirsutum]